MQTPEIHFGSTPTEPDSAFLLGLTYLSDLCLLCMLRQREGFTMPRPSFLLHIALVCLLQLLWVIECEGQPSYACAGDPCQNDGTCLIGSRDSSNFLCHCSEFYNGTFCEKYIGPTDCRGNPCQNGGTCFLGTSITSVLCQCPDQYSGFLCHLPEVSPCDSSPCLENGVCTNQDTGFSCSCAPGYAGASCGLSIRTTCASFPCSNGGTCFVSSLDVKDFYCLCPAGFSGDHCQLAVTECSCENGGSCHSINLPAGGMRLQCLCPPGYTGTRCEVAPTNVCDKQPCQFGDCFLHATNPSEFFCYCYDGYTGERCDTQVTPEGCSPNPCLHRGLCLVTSPTTVACQCSLGYVGPRCQYIGACYSNPCLHNGTCYNPYQPQIDTPGFACVCPEGFRGLLCDEIALPHSEPCASSPCEHEGACFQSDAGNEFTCICNVGYSGETCQQREGMLCADNPFACSGPGEVCMEAGDNFSCECRRNWRRKEDNSGCHAPCTISPCMNNGQCFLHDNREEFYCVCPEGFNGTFCEVPVFPCDCKNGGICVTISSAFFCDCVAGYSGIDCSIPPPNQRTTMFPLPGYPCFEGACKNGGTCEPFGLLVGYHCICRDGFAGLDCSERTTVTNPRTTSATTTTTIAPATTKQKTVPPRPSKNVCKTDNPCRNGAICYPNTNIRGELYPMCRCRYGFAGATCSVRLPIPTVCHGDPCGSGAICYSNASAPWGFSCACLQSQGCAGDIIAGSGAPPLDSPCENNPCQNNGSCFVEDNIVKCGCPTYIVGDFCETDIRECTFKNMTYNEGHVRTDGCVSCNCTNGDWQCSTDRCYCEHDEKIYEIGQTWSDLCMTCFCYNGGWLCSDSDCRNTCEHNGNRYFSGHVREESCETCFCSNKTWTCTRKQNCEYCVDGDAVYFEGSERDVDCNVCTCVGQGWQCTVKNCDELPLTLSLSFHLDYPFSLIEGRETNLIRVIKAHMEAHCNLNLEQLVGIWLSEGSIVVNMTLYESSGTDQDIRLAAQRIEEKVSSGTLQIAFDGYLISAKADSYSEVIMLPAAKTSLLWIFILSATFVLSIIMTFIIGFCLCKKNRPSLNRKRKSTSRRRLFKPRGSKSSEVGPPSPSGDVQKGQGEALDLPQRVMTCPGRLRQTGLEGITEDAT